MQCFSIFLTLSRLMMERLKTEQILQPHLLTKGRVDHHILEMKMNWLKEDYKGVHKKSSPATDHQSNSYRCFPISVCSIILRCQTPDGIMKLNWMDLILFSSPQGVLNLHVADAWRYLSDDFIQRKIMLVADWGFYWQRDRLVIFASLSHVSLSRACHSFV